MSQQACMFARFSQTKFCDRSRITHHASLSGKQCPQRFFFCLVILLILFYGFQIGTKWLKTIPFYWPATNSAIYINFSVHLKEWLVVVVGSDRGTLWIWHGITVSMRATNVRKRMKKWAIKMHIVENYNPIIRWCKTCVDYPPLFEIAKCIIERG